MSKKFITRVLYTLLSCILILATAACNGAAPVSQTSQTSTKSVAASGNSTESSPAAGSALAAEKNAELEVLFWADGSFTKGENWQVIFDSFAKKYPDVKVTQQSYPSAEYHTKLDARMAANDWPDVFRQSYVRFGKYKEADVLLDLTGKVPQQELDDYSPGFLKACMSNGKLIALPHHTDTVAVFYNKAMFEKSGIRIPKNVNDGWSWNELIEIAKKLKKDNNLSYAFSGIWQGNSGWRYLPFIYMNGGSMLSDDLTQVTIDQPKTIEAIKLYKTCLDEGLIDTTGMTQPATANSLFFAQKTAFVFAGSWHCGSMKESLGDNWGVTYMPQVNGKTGSDMGGNGLLACKATKYPNASAMFLLNATSKDTMKEFCEFSNFIPIRKSLMSEGLNYKNFPDEMKKFLEIAATVDPKMAAVDTSDHFAALNQIFVENMDDMIIGGKSPEEVAANMAVKMKEVIK